MESNLNPDSLLDIIENLSSSQKRKKRMESKEVVERKFEVQIFPRYHQLEVIRSLRETVKVEGVERTI